MKKKDIATIAVILTAACLLAGFFYLQSKRQTTPKEEVWVYKDNVVILAFDPHVDKEYEIDGYYGKMTIEVKAGSWRVINVECPNHNCEQFGWQTMDDYWMPITCIPNHVYIQPATE